MNLFTIILFNLSILKPISSKTLNLDTRRSNHDTNRPREKEIARLEREREELFSKISSGIDESVKQLMRSNDSDAKEGIELVTALKKQVELLNNNKEDIDLKLPPLKLRRESSGDEKYFRRGNRRIDLFRRENDETSKTGSVEIKTKDELDGKENDERNKSNESEINDDTNKDEETDGEIKPRALEDSPFRAKKKKKAGTYFNDKLFDDRHRSNRTWERYKERDEMRERVEEWLKKKAAEVAAIKEYKRKQINDTVRELSVKEPCPREGVQSKYNKNSKDYKQGLRGLRGYYPCCRKCCRRSYLGCL